MKQMQISLSKLAAAIDRLGVFNQTAAFIATVVLQDEHKMSQENKIKVI